MARKNLIGISTQTETPAATPAAPPAPARPIAGLTPPARAAVPVGGITRTLGSITEKMERAEALERQLTEGRTVIEIDPALVDASFVRDRIAIDPEGLAELVAQIGEHGQQVPVLLRPHPETPGRYQVAYGHRRLAAVKQLGGRLRAVVRDLTDENLVISQGQENNARRNLSYIERALFAARLEERAFSRDVIMSALAVDKAAVSKMIGVVRSLPVGLIEAIGSAPETGRRRWMELAEKLPDLDLARLLAWLGSEAGRKVSSDQRFQAALEAANTKRQPDADPVGTVAEGVPVRFKASGGQASLIFDRKAAPGFDDFVRERMAGLYAEFTRLSGK